MSGDLVGQIRAIAVGLVGRRALRTGAIIVAMSSVVVIAAVTADGTAATNIQLDDGSVWVTNEASHQVGRLNIRINELDFGLNAGGQPDVVQDGRSVFFDRTGKGVQRLDVVSGGAPLLENELAIGDYQVNGGIGLATDDQGRLWVGPGETFVAPDHPDAADHQIEAGSFVVVTDPSRDRVDALGRERGKVLIVEPSGWYELELGPDRKPVRDGQAHDDGASSDRSTTSASDGPDDGADDEGSVPIKPPTMRELGVAFDQIAAITSVGDVLVLRLADGSVMTPGGKPVEVPGNDVVLQQPGPAAGAALVASTDGLFELSLGGGTLAKLGDASARPAAPVRVGPCAFGAWSGATPTSFKSCNGEVLRDREPIPGAKPEVELIFRVNQRNVALNSPGDGGVWADHEGSLVSVGNWAEVEDQSIDDTIDPDQLGESLEVTERTCEEDGEDAPTAGDDIVGVRPRQSIIEVLNNDDDVNCEPIAIASVSPDAGDWGQLAIIDDGQHLLYLPSQSYLDAASESRQSFQFTYLVSDTTGHESSPATVTMTVADVQVENSLPALRPKRDGKTRKMSTVVEEGKSISYDVFESWWDPDGDDLRLASATVADGAGEVAITPDGTVRYAANGVAPGLHNVAIEVSDGVSSTTAQLEVTVKPAGSEIPPETSNDYLTLVEGETGLVWPLANDSDPNGTEPSLRPLWTPDDATTFRTKLVEEGTAVEVTAISAGVYALYYEATDHIDATKGAIRLTVVAPESSNTGPIAIPDQVKLRANRVVNVDVLSNDLDEDGDILSITDVVSGNPEQVRASIVDRRLLQLEVVPGADGEPPTGPFVVTYDIDDGHADERAKEQDEAERINDGLRASGTVTISIQPPSEDQPPRAEDDEAVVRSGDVVAVPVLRNDVDPDADELVLESIDEERALELETTGAGVAWLQDRSVYFQGDEPGSYDIRYTVSAGGKRTTATVAFQVTDAPDPESNPNQAPTPPDLELRAIRGGEVRLRVPTFGIDPDGDSVKVLDVFSGLTGSARGNRVARDADAADVLLFTAGPNAGTTDRFTYTVVDRYGLQGTGNVEVVVVDDGGWAPQAHDDALRGRPGRTLSVPVLSNDSSPQDRRLELAAEPFFDLEGQVTAQPQHPDAVQVLDQEVPESRGRIEVTVPTDGTAISEHYRISDGINPSDAYIRISPDPDTPNRRPIANEDVVELDPALKQDSVDVDVLRNDFDPDDAGGELIVTVPSNQTATVAGAVVTVPLQLEAQIVLYRITDADGAESIGIIRVPGTENLPPRLNSAGRDREQRIIAADAVEDMQIVLDDWLEDPNGDPDIELTPTEIVVLGGLGEVRRDGDDAFAYTPPGELTEQTVITIQFEVTDRPGKSVEERQLPGCNCLSTISLELVIEASSPPRILSDGAISVPQLDEPVEYDLANLAADDQGDALTFELLDEASFSALDVVQSGSKLSIVSRRDGDDTLPVGSQFDVRFTVDDGSFDPVEGLLVVTIIATNKGRPAAAELSALEAERDVNISTPNLLRSAFNPFADRPLELVTWNASGGANVDCTPSGDCQFLSTTFGTFDVTYTLRDAVGQQATGSLPVVVKGKPRAPTIPSKVGVGDHEVMLSWAETTDMLQGGQFVAYHVTAVESGVTKTFDGPGGTFDGLDNGTEYTFTVRAENEVGHGEESAPSSGMTPDRVPGLPLNPRFTDYQDKQLSLAWDPPADAADYTAITEYEVILDPGGQSFTTGGATSLVVGSGGKPATLDNSTTYTFTVKAKNSATENGGWGNPTTASPTGDGRPSRYPNPPTGVTATNSGDGGTPRLTVQWSAPSFDGGRAITGYRVCRVQTPATCQTTPAGVLTATFDVVKNEASSFTVVASNSDKNRSESDASAASPSVVAVGDPDAPVISSVTSGNHQLTANATTTNNSGCGSYTIWYHLTGNGQDRWQSSATFTGLTNGKSYSITAEARLAASCGTPGKSYVSDLSNAKSGTPYGPLVKPTVNASLSGTRITWTWSTNRADDGRPDWKATLSGACGSASVSAGSYSRDYGYGTSTYNCTLTISASGVASKSDDAPQKQALGKITVSRGAAAPSGYWYNTTVNGPPGWSTTLYCHDGVDTNFYSQNVTLNGSGFYQDTTLCYSADPNPHWVTGGGLTSNMANF